LNQATKFPLHHVKWHVSVVNISFVTTVVLHVDGSDVSTEWLCDKHGLLLRTPVRLRGTHKTISEDINKHRKCKKIYDKVTLV